MNVKNRFRNIYFIIGLIGVIGSALGIDPTTLTSWGALWDLVYSILMNPFQLGLAFMAVLGLFVNPNTPGLRD